MSQRLGETRVELWVNAPDEAEYQPLAVHLDQLEAAGTIDEYVVYHWGHELDVSSDRLRCVEDQLARERVSAFKQWAAAHDCTVLGLGERVTAGVGRVGPEVTFEHLPPVVLAEYVGDELQRVTPCSAEKEHVSERLNALDTPAQSVDDVTFDEVNRPDRTVLATTVTPDSEPSGPGWSDSSLRARLTRWLR